MPTQVYEDMEEIDEFDPPAHATVYPDGGMLWKRGGWTYYRQDTTNLRWKRRGKSGRKIYIEVPKDEEFVAPREGDEGFSYDGETIPPLKCEPLESGAYFWLGKNGEKSGINNN